MKRCASCTSAHGSRFAKTLSEPDTRAHRGERGFFSSLYVQVYGRARPRRTMMKSVMHVLFFSSCCRSGNLVFIASRYTARRTRGWAPLFQEGLSRSRERPTEKFLSRPPAVIVNLMSRFWVGKQERFGCTRMCTARVIACT